MKHENYEFFRKIYFRTGLVLFLVSIVFHTSPGLTGELGFPSHYPSSFDGSGRIDRIAADEVVINDTLLALSPDIRYHTRKIKNASSAWFKVGCLVGFVKDSTDRISALYLIEKSKP